jgi:hypothetical protein
MSKYDAIIPWMVKDVDSGADVDDAARAGVDLYDECAAALERHLNEAYRHDVTEWTHWGRRLYAVNVESRGGTSLGCCDGFASVEGALAWAQHTYPIAGRS